MEHFVKHVVVCCLLITVLTGCSKLYAQNRTPSFDNPATVASWIDKVGVNAALDKILDRSNTSLLKKTLKGIRTGDDEWLVVLSKLRPPLMASVDAIQFDAATSEALDKNPVGVLKVAGIINAEWNKLAHIDTQNIHYPYNICGGYPDEWNEDISDQKRASEAIPILKKRLAVIEEIDTSEVPEAIKSASIECIKTAIKVVSGTFFKK